MSAGGMVSTPGAKTSRVKALRTRHELILDATYGAIEAAAKVSTFQTRTYFSCPGTGHPITPYGCAERQKCARLVPAIAAGCEKCERYEPNRSS